jgi:hypothetical protein
VDINQALMMKTRSHLLLTAWLLCMASTGNLPAQEPSGGATAFRQQFEQFQTQAKTQFHQFRDSANREYARYLAQTWKTFELYSPRTAPGKPGPAETPHYTPAADSLPNAVLSVDSIVAPTSHTGDVYPRIEPPARHAAAVRPPVQLTFFGVAVEVSHFDGFDLRLPGIGEMQVANGWMQFANAPCHALIRELLALKDEMLLNDWAFYCLLCQIADRYFPPERTNEKTLFTIFFLNQTGYRARIGRANDRLVSLIAFRTAVYGKYFITFPDGNYYVFAPDGSPDSRVYSYPQNCTLAETNISLAVQKPFRLTVDAARKELSFGGKTYAVEYNQNLIALYRTCPQTELQVYASSHLSGLTRRSLEKALLPELEGKSASEAVSFLLTFVQSAFAYRTDREQFGAEKYFFAEEMFHYPWSDCEDRAVLFAQLVKSFTGLEVVLLDYDDHVATAVRLDNDVEGDCIHINNVCYAVCDPTYIGAPVGRAMKEYRNRKVRVLTLNF